MKKRLIKTLAGVFTVALAAGLAACGGTNGYENGDEANGYDDVGPGYYIAGDIYIPLCPLFSRPLYELREGWGDRLWATTARFTEYPMDLRGRNIHIMTDNYFFFNYWPDIDATPNETMHIIDQMRTIEEDYNMTFSYEAAPLSTAVWERIVRARIGGDMPYDIININIGHTNPDIMFRQGVFLDLYAEHLAHIMDFENNPWHYGRYMSQLWGRQHGVHFTTANSGTMLNSVLTFNINFMDELRLGSFYDMVHNGTWTFSNFDTILRHVQHWDSRVLPMAAFSERYSGPGFIFANGGRTVERDADGHLVFVALENQRAIDAIQFLANLHSWGLFEIIPGVIPNRGDTPDEKMIRAAAGGIMFMVGEYEITRTMTRQQPPFQSEFLFGLLPIPKGDHMDDFVSAMVRYDMYYIVDGIHRPEEVAAILVAMANRTSKLYVIEHELRFGVRDERCAEILRMMLDRQEIDYSRMVSIRGRLSTQIRDAIRGFAPVRTSLERQEISIMQTLEELRIPPN